MTVEYFESMSKSWDNAVNKIKELAENGRN